MIGARSDFVPEGICAQLRQLQDQVPPMSTTRAEAILKLELGVGSLTDVFEWIDLDSPLGSASIAQVSICCPYVSFKL
jgi:predicted unusual protein kinase regulating ubiquinone biosynthesis (AarF/ABC1/UbiB family)